ncbi:hypothetical protein AVEN_200444-1 [Araneus ventricosus]|uniref:MATH domain-containing protein n=1 Tax=Araneus ventricosus TaxID=182803 RepID=A0A4Y2TGP5_ARAVE|nr:hypothetical protein AVEN_130284-1 [Araneus ventricosus]GBN99808.1 hypothetical protein AVEN_200444-1 [Araneus ventricosus]
MAENFKEAKQEMSDGHQVVFNFHVHHLDGKLLWQTVKDYDTDCRALPTSWLFEMHLQQVPINGNVSIPVTLKRNDTANRPVNAYVTIGFTDPNCSSFFDDVISFGRRYVKPGEEIQENIVLYIRLPEKRKLFNEDLLVTVAIRIRSCHSGSISNPLSPDKKRKLCSMM